MIKYNTKTTNIRGWCFLYMFLKPMRGIDLFETPGHKNFTCVLNNGMISIPTSRYETFLCFK